MTDEPPRRARRGGIRRKPTEPTVDPVDPKWPNGRPGPKKGQKPFDPLSQTWVAQGKSWMARKARADRAKRVSDAEWLANHFQLSPSGSLPEDERSTHKSAKEREERYASLMAFPRIPEHELQELERLIGAYGVPLSDLSSDTAAFVVRRVMMDFHRLSTLRRAVRKPLFTPDELVGLMREMRLKPAQLAEVLAPGAGISANAAMNSINRWMHGVSQPTSVLGVKVNRLIEQRVRRRPAGGAPMARREEDLSQKKETASRRARKERQDRQGQMQIPLSYAAQKAREEADADETTESAETD